MWMCVWTLVLGALWLSLPQTEAGNEEPVHDVPPHHPHHTVRLLKPPPPEPINGAEVPLDQYFFQYLDHYNPADQRTWVQKWYEQKAFAKKKGPVFIFIEGEAPADPRWLTAGHTVKMAKAMGASIYMLEHRYYGKSRPTKDMSTENLKWLTAEQALGDIAHFIRSLRQYGYIETDAKIVAFGGSYPGNLAAWARLKFPHLIHASVASSAPIQAKADFYEYLEVVTQSLKSKAGQWCVDNIKKGVQHIHSLLDSGEDGVKQVFSAFRVCNNLDLSNPLDRQNFLAYLDYPFSGAVQYNRPENNSDSINNICSTLRGNNLSAEEAMNALGVLIAGTGQGCLDYTFDRAVQDLKNTTWGEDSERQWFYQTCTEFGYYQTDDAKNLPFGYQSHPLSLYEAQCKAVFGDEIRIDLDRAISRTNGYYGGIKPALSRVIFVNGGIDPWHALSPTKEVNFLSPAVYIKGASHCYDMLAPDKTDSFHLKKGRALIHTYLKVMLKT